MKSFEIDAIKPKGSGNESDKYSRLFYKWVKKNWKRGGIQIFCAQRNPVDGNFWLFDNDAQRADIYIGSRPREKEIWGQSVTRILIGGKGVGSITIPEDKIDKVIDITDWFWTEYLARGRCIFDMEHERSFLYDENRYLMHESGRQRECLWCGEHQVLRSQTFTIMKDVWEKE